MPADPIPDTLAATIAQAIREAMLIGPAEMLDVRGVAGLVGMSPRWVSMEAAARRFPRAIKLGTAARWRRREVLSWIDEKTPAGEGEGGTGPNTGGAR